MLPFGEDAANRIEGLFTGTFSRQMQEIDHGAVEFAKTKIGTADVLRHLGAGSGNDRLETCIRFFNSVDAIGTDEVQAEPGVNHCADNEWLDPSAFPLQNSVGSLVSPLQSSIGIRLPEVNPRSEPVVVVLAWLKGLIEKQAFAGLPVAAVVAKNKSCGKVMHPAGTAW